MKKIIIKKNIILEDSSLADLDFNTDYESLKIKCFDVKKNSICIEINNYKAIRIKKMNNLKYYKFACEECYYDGKYHRHILEILDSDWIKEAKQSTTYKIGFKSLRHFIFFAGNNIIEVLSNNIKIIKRNYQ